MRTGIAANTIVTPALPNIIEFFAVDAALAGLVLSAATLPGIGLAPIIGLLADRYGRREVVVPCLVIYALAGAIAAMATTFWALIALRFAQGLGSAGLINLAVVIIGDHWDGTERARTLGRNSAVLAVGLALLPALGGVLADLGGWRASFVPYILGLGPAWVAARVLPPARRETIDVWAHLAEARLVLRTKAVTGVMVAGIAVFILIYGLFLTVLPLHLESRFGLSASARGAVLSLSAMTNAIAALRISTTQQLLGKRPAMVMAACVLALAAALLAQAPSVAWLSAGVLLFGLGEGTLLPGLQDIAIGSTSAPSRGTVIAVWMSSIRSGQTAGPLLAGLSFARFDARLTFLGGGALALGIAGALFLALRDISPGPSTSVAETTE